MLLCKPSLYKTAIHDSEIISISVDNVLANHAAHTGPFSKWMIFYYITEKISTT